MHRPLAGRRPCSRRARPSDQNLNWSFPRSRRGVSVTSTFTTIRIVRQRELRKESSLESAIQSFFVGNYVLAEKTKEFYLTYLTAYGNFLRQQLEREPVIADIDKD